MGGLKGAASGIKDKITGGGGGKGGGGSKATKSTNIVESIDVGVPLRSPTTSGPSSARSRAS